MGKTMAAFFNGWPSENISQIYFHTEVPNSDICKRYFRITDFDMVEAIFKFKKPGKVLNEKDIKLNTASSRVDNGIMAKIYRVGRKRKPYMYLIRNFLWETNNKWRTPNLIKWIDDYNPEVLFYAAGDYSFSIKIALNICKLKKIPMVVFIGDDYYFLNMYKFSLINWFVKKKFKAVFSNMFSYLSCFIAASDKMQREYSKEFNKCGYALMTPTKVSSIVNSANQNKISYIGNLGYNRWKSLIEIGKCLKHMGQVLNIYSGENRKNVIEQLNLENGIIFHGAVSSSKVTEIINLSTILVHVESMDKINREKTRYSMSTKIADSLGSGVCIFAYGPEDVSSIDYLVQNDAACIVTRKEDLQNKLQEILNNEQLRKKYANNALQLAFKRHDLNNNTQLFYKIMTEACIKKEGNTYENFTG
jgi:glycosyltransferase involved in cell wall biosynthesis